MDGHDTHKTPELKCVVYKWLDKEDLEIIIFCFPSKCTHKCQPLGVMIFSGVEHKWQGVCDGHLQAEIPINCFTVIPAYIHGTQGTMTKELIAKAFEKTGLYPVNCGVFQPQDFTLSKASSSIVYVPNSFPHLPSSDPIEPSDDNFIPSSDDEDSSSESELLETKGPGSDTEASGDKPPTNDELDVDESEPTTREDYLGGASQDSTKQILAFNWS